MCASYSLGPHPCPRSSALYSPVTEQVRKEAAVFHLGQARPAEAPLPSAGQKEKALVPTNAGEQAAPVDDPVPPPRKTGGNGVKDRTQQVVNPRLTLHISNPNPAPIPILRQAAFTSHSPSLHPTRRIPFLPLPSSRTLATLLLLPRNLSSRFSACCAGKEQTLISVPRHLQRMAATGPASASSRRLL